MKALNVYLDDDEFEELEAKKVESGLSWKKFILKSAGVKVK